MQLGICDLGDVMSKFKVVSQKPSEVTFDLADSEYSLERISLDPIDAEIVEVDAKSGAVTLDAVAFWIISKYSPEEVKLSRVWLA